MTDMSVKNMSEDDNVTYTKLFSTYIPLISFWLKGRKIEMNYYSS